MKETKNYQTESKELLSLMINSIYSNKEIFLRELISNASDAIDKYHFESIKDVNKFPTSNGEIYLETNKENRTITIIDNGIGMNKKDLDNNLGIIAKSGSKEFQEKLKKAKKGTEDINIIGQFGVGFYSAFMVASKIEVYTKKINDKCYLFTSDGIESYTIEDSEELKDHGTKIVIYLKKDEDEIKYSDYLEEYMIKDLVKKHSDYIRYPIKMNVKVTKPELDKDGKEIKDKTIEVNELQTLNSMIPIWKKNPKDVTEEEKNEFYKSKFNEYKDPFCSLFINVDGLISYNAVIYIPGETPFNLYSENYERGLDLYAKGIFINSNIKELVPDYLKFIKGVVDSNDFNLNISREMLQDSPLLKKMQDNIEKKVIAKLKDYKDKEFDKYLEFYKNFGESLKYGIYTSYGFKGELLKDLILFNSLKENKLISLKDYVDKKADKQDKIYYASGKDLETIKLIPQIEKYKKEGKDVLLLDQRIDEFAIMMLREYDKMQFVNIASETVNNEVSEEEKKVVEEKTVSNKRLLDNIKEALKDKVDDVVISSKLVDSPVCISTKEGLSLNMEETLNEQSKALNKEGAKSIKVLEINPNHDLFKALSAIQDKDDDVKNYASVLYEEAMMLEGFDIKDKTSFIKKLNDLMLKALK